MNWDWIRTRGNTELYLPESLRTFTTQVNRHFCHKSVKEEKTTHCLYCTPDTNVARLRRWFGVIITPAPLYTRIMPIAHPAKVFFTVDDGWNSYLEKHGNSISQWNRFSITHARLWNLRHGRTRRYAYNGIVVRKASE